MSSHDSAQISESGPLAADEMTKLRACLHDEITLEAGADTEVHGLYDYFETTRRLVDTVAAREASAERWANATSAAEAERDRLRLFIHDRYVALCRADGKYGYQSRCGICQATGEADSEPPHETHCILAVR